MSILLIMLNISRIVGIRKT